MDFELREAIQIISELAKKNQSTGREDDAIKMVDLFLGKPLSESNLSSRIEKDGTIVALSGLAQSDWEKVRNMAASANSQPKNEGYKLITTLVISKDL